MFKSNSKRKNAKSAETVFLAACNVIKSIRDGQRRGLRYSPAAAAKLVRLECMAWKFTEEAFGETYPGKVLAIARHHRRVAVKQPRRAKKRLAYAVKLEREAARAFA